MARFYIEYLGNSIELPLGENILGRDLTCRIRFNDPSVSRQHVRLVVDYGSAIVEDLASTNGTTLNGDPLVGPRSLGDGDKLCLGGAVLGITILQQGDPPKIE